MRCRDTGARYRPVSPLGGIIDQVVQDCICPCWPTLVDIPSRVIDLSAYMNVGFPPPPQEITLAFKVFLRLLQQPLLGTDL